MFKENILLSHHSHYKIGGQAKYFFEAGNTEEVIKALEKACQTGTFFRRLPIFVLGAGTNVLFDDAGFGGLILKPNIQFIEKGENFLRVGAGISIDQLLDYLVSKNLSGLEWAAGLPGTLGGAIRGNAGAFGGEMKNIVEEVVSINISKPEAKIIKRKNQDCDFGYRSSIFKRQPFGKLPPKTRLARGGRTSEIIVEATLIFKKGDRKLMRRVIEENINYRQERQPIEYPNIGSIFKNVDCRKVSQGHQYKKFESVIKTDPFPVIPAAYLIYEAGLAGVSYGGAMISPKHPNFIVNVLKATSQDVKNLIKLAKTEVKSKFGINLEQEITYLA